VITATRLTGVDETVRSLYAKGLTTGEAGWRSGLLGPAFFPRDRRSTIMDCSKRRN
jgi:hypothetical protein